MSVVPKVFRAVVIGAPGAGKGTLSKKLASLFDMVHISMGDIIWSNIKSKTKLGILSEPYVRRGELVPDGIMSNLVLKVFDRFQVSPGDNEISWIIDGFPRTERQASFLWSKASLDMAIHLSIPLKESFKRHEHKLVHIPSGRCYNAGFNTPQRPGKDDLTGEDLEYLDDNHKDIVMKRFELYEKHRRNLFKFYERLGILHVYKDGFNEKTLEHVKLSIEKKNPDENFILL